MTASTTPGQSTGGSLRGTILQRAIRTKRTAQHPQFGAHTVPASRCWYTFANGQLCSVSAESWQSGMHLARAYQLSHCLDVGRGVGTGVPVTIKVSVVERAPAVLYAVTWYARTSDAAMGVPTIAPSFASDSPFGRAGDTLKPRGRAPVMLGGADSACMPWASMICGWAKCTCKICSSGTCEHTSFTKDTSRELDSRGRPEARNWKRALPVDSFVTPWQLGSCSHSAVASPNVLKLPHWCTQPRRNPRCGPEK